MVRKTKTETETTPKLPTATDVLTLLWNAAEADHSARNARKVAEAGRVGAYDSMMIAGRAAGTAEAFSTAYETVKDAMKKNADGWAVKLELEPDSKKPGQFKIPGNFRVAASEVLSALKAGISLDQPFSKMRDARKAAEAATVTEAEQAAAIVAGDKVAIIRDLCRQIGENAELLTETQRDEAIQLLGAVLTATTAGDAKTAERRAA